MQRRILFLLALLLLLAIPTGVTLAAQTIDKGVNADDVIRNDVILFNEDFDLADGGRVTGDIIIFNGNARIAGTVNGDVVLFNGNLTTEATASLNGDCVLFNGQVSAEDSSAVSCTHLAVTLPDGVINFAEGLVSSTESSTTQTATVERPSSFSSFAWGTAAAVARSLLFGLLAFAAASVMPRQMLHIEETMRAKPVASGTVGLLTAISMLLVIPILLLISTLLILACLVGLLGFPIIFALLMGLIAAGFLGWFTMGNIVGEFFAKRLNWKSRSQAVTTALGTMVITFVIGLLGTIPFVFGESVISWVIISLGLGATMLTKFGTRAYPIVALPTVDDDKVTAVLDTLPDEPDTSD